MQIVDTEDFKCEIKNNCVIILEYKKNNEVIEFPDNLFDLPVTALGDYVVAGKDCKEIYIPGGIKKVGRYGFYNCRNLKVLSCTSDFMDIGCGAFTGCHNIERIEMKMNTEESCLKEILLEIQEELVVILKGKINAVMWFPEFFEEGVENTPARILMTQVHGSGLYYRNCFAGKKFNFLEYDKRFVMACAQESKDLLIELVYGRLFKPYELSEQAKKEYVSFVKENGKAFLEKFLNEKRDEDFIWILNDIILTKEEYSQIVNKATAMNMPGITSVLMSYGRKYFPIKRKSFDL